jgi:DNA end-binding protein Ku
MATSWKGSISFGMVYIPVSLMLAASDSGISFNMLHQKCGSRVNYKKICPVCNTEVSHDELVKGYQYEDGKYVVMTEDDIEKIKTPKDKSINILQFVNQEEIDPIFYEKSYYIVPNGGEKAFELLRQAMQAENKVGIAKMVLGTKESLVALRVSNDTMLLNTLFFLNEIKGAPPGTANMDVSSGEVELARALINSMAASFQPEQFHDEYQEKLKQAIEQKISGQEVVTAPQEEANNVISLMDALAASLKAREGSPHRKTS